MDERDAVKLPEPTAWLVTGGRTYRDKAFISRDNAWQSVIERKDGASLEPLHTADQVGQAVREAVAAERERCAQIADAERDASLPSAAQNNGRGSDFAFGSVNGAERIASAIRGTTSQTEKE